MYSLNLKKIVEEALVEDSGFFDPVSFAIEGSVARGVIFAKEDIIFCGSDVIRSVFKTVDSELSIEFSFRDGDAVNSGSEIGLITGSAGAILKGERVALNFTQRLSGISTLTRRFVDKVKGTGVKICDTRKTTPMLRFLEKYAVRCGGGVNHRFSLSDGVIIKDNAITIFGSVKEAVTRIRENTHHLLKIQVEVENISEFKEALTCGVDAILLDNMSCEEVSKAVSLGKGRVILEASGNITLENVRRYAETGVDIISSGILTHSAPSMNISLEFTK